MSDRDDLSIASYKRSPFDFAEHCTLPADLAAIKSSLEAIANRPCTAPTPSTFTWT